MFKYLEMVTHLVGTSEVITESQHFLSHQLSIVSHPELLELELSSPCVNRVTHFLSYRLSIVSYLELLELELSSLCVNSVPASVLVSVMP